MRHRWCVSDFKNNVARINQQFADLMQTARADLGLSCYELAQKIGCGITIIQRSESANRRVVMGELAPICWGLRISPIWFLQSRNKAEINLDTIKILKRRTDHTLHAQYQAQDYNQAVNTALRMTAKHLKQTRKTLDMTLDELSANSGHERVFFSQNELCNRRIDLGEFCETCVLLEEKPEKMFRRIMSEVNKQLTT